VRGLLVLLLVVFATSARADVGVILGEPYGRGSSYNPTGHIAVYLSRVCAATPTTLRRCGAGEAGSVISRYNHLPPVDWVVIPLIPYLYAVEQASDAVDAATPEQVRALRERYRAQHLADFAPAHRVKKEHDWVQLVGAAYDRQIVVFTVRTTPEQDDRLIDALNHAENRTRFNLLFRNCADFARDLINRHYYPSALRSNVISDLGFTTPKQVAKAFVRHAHRHPELDLRAFLVPQVPGNRAHSDRARGVLESVLRLKRYAIPLGLAEPWLPVGIAAAYLTTGRFNPQREVMDTPSPVEIERSAQSAAMDAAAP
jgi:hypothetical protein